MKEIKIMVGPILQATSRCGFSLLFIYIYMYIYIYIYMYIYIYIFIYYHYYYHLLWASFRLLASRVSTSGLRSGAYVSSSGRP